jgi:cbb3-type cytochrome oxidase cytochrome c subunit
MSIKDTIIESKNLLIAISTIVAISLGAISYFAKAADLQNLQQDYYQNKMYQRLNYLDQRIGDLEIKYNCYSDSCKSKMPSDLYREYREKQIEKGYIEKNTLKPQDIK